MGTHQIILANEPRLLRGLLRRAIAKVPGLDVVDEVENVSRLPSAVKQWNADWLVVSLWSDGEMPSNLASLLEDHGSLYLLGMAGDGSEVRILRPELPEKRMCDLSLAELVGVFRGHRERG